MACYLRPKPGALDPEPGKPEARKRASGLSKFQTHGYPAAPASGARPCCWTVPGHARRPSRVLAPSPPDGIPGRLEGGSPPTPPWARPAWPRRLAQSRGPRRDRPGPQDAALGGAEPPLRQARESGTHQAVTMTHGSQYKDHFPAGAEAKPEPWPHHLSALLESGMDLPAWKLHCPWSWACLPPGEHSTNSNFAASEALRKSVFICRNPGQERLKCILVCILGGVGTTLTPEVCCILQAVTEWARRFPC
nr:uncharacterized protein LOC129017623 [Pongo pygmaeus]